mgnify:CR=1 FL=1
MREERKVKILWAVVAAVGAACAIYTIVYLARPSSFASEGITVDNACYYESHSHTGYRNSHAKREIFIRGNVRNLSLRTTL